MYKNKTPGVKPLYIVKLNLKRILLYSVLNNKKEFESACDGYLTAFASAIELMTIEGNKNFNDLQ